MCNTVVDQIPKQLCVLSSRLRRMVTISPSDLLNEISQQASMSRMSSSSVPLDSFASGICEGAGHEAAEAFALCTVQISLSSAGPRQQNHMEHNNGVSSDSPENSAIQEVRVSAACPQESVERQ